MGEGYSQSLTYETHIQTEHTVELMCFGYVFGVGWVRQNFFVSKEFHSYKFSRRGFDGHLKVFDAFDNSLAFGGTDISTGL